MIENNKSLLSRFLLSPSTMLCLVVRLAILFKFLPEPYHFAVHHPAVQSLWIRPFQHYDINAFQSSGSWDIVPSIQYSMLALVTDFVVSYALLYFGYRQYLKEQNDEEGRLYKNDIMPEAIQPKHYNLFGLSGEDDAAFIPRSTLPHLAANIYLWGTVISSSTTSTIYAGLLVNLWTVLSPKENLYQGDPLVLIFLIPVALSVYRQPKSRFRLPILAFLLGLLLSGSYNFVIVRKTPELPSFSTPNLGMQWYFVMQLFLRFRQYFAIMFAGLGWILVLPLLIRFSARPVEMTTCFLFVYTLFARWPTLTDFLVTMSFMLLSPRSLARMNLASVVSLCALPVTISLYVLHWTLWLESGTGNANYLYFQGCLAYNVFVTIIFTIFCSATVQRDTAIYLTLELLEKDENNLTKDNESSKEKKTIRLSFNKIFSLW